MAGTANDFNDVASRMAEPLKAGLRLREPVKKSFRITLAVRNG